MTSAADYVELAEALIERAPGIEPVLAGCNACVDHVYRMDGDRLEALAGQRGTVVQADQLADQVLQRVRAGRGGEIFTPWPAGPRWAATLFGPPDARQVGGTGPQAAWSLAVLGAPTVIALADRGSEQLAVLHPRIAVCTGGSGTTAVADLPPAPTPPKPPHVICEFTSGTRWSGGTVSRSTRIILRFAVDGIERDDLFARYPGPAGAALLSGLNGLPAEDTEDRDWMRATVARWRARGVPLLHHELAEFVDPAELRVASTALPVTSLGMSLSELRTLAGSRSADPTVVAARLAIRLGVQRLCVHSDAWSLAVHTSDPGTERTALAAGNLLAAARAAAGHPVARPYPPPGSRYTEDHPTSRELGDGWRVDCVPAPYLPAPAATIGLGDTFTAGTLLGRLLDPVPVNHRERVL
jgi:ADP-dependent phosphofructokinase/glucokinase